MNIFSSINGKKSVDAERLSDEGLDTPKILGYLYCQHQLHHRGKTLVYTDVKCGCVIWKVELNLSNLKSV